MTEVQKRRIFSAIKHDRGLCPGLLALLGWEERPDGIAIPWEASNGTQAWHIRGRDNRWRWAGHDSEGILPYKLPSPGTKSEIAAAVESETDAVALWTAFNGNISVLASGGAQNWKARWQESLKGFSRVVVWWEDQASTALVRAVSSSAPSGAEVAVVANWGGISKAKDPGRILAEYLSTGAWGQGCERLKSLLDRALPLKLVTKDQLSEEIADRLEGLGHRVTNPSRNGDRQALCVFHHEHRPSLSFGPQGFHCFGCGQKGSLEELGAALGLLVEAGKNPSGVEKEKKPLVVCLSSVEPECVEWLWEPYVAQGKLTLLEGDPGCGKSWLSLAIAAILSRGWPFPGPDGAPAQVQTREPSSILFLAGEDGLADTVRPRLETIGGDPSRLFFLQGVVVKDDSQKEIEAVSLANLETLEEAVTEVRPKLLVVDPIQAFLGPIDMHRANEVRPLLAGLASLAEKHKFACLAIRHLTKSPKDQSIYRGLGSIDFSAIARSILLIGRHPEDAGLRALAQVKNSLAPPGPSLAFELGEHGFCWRGECEITAEALLAPPQTGEKKLALEEAAEFLREALQGGPRPSKEVIREAESAGVSERLLKEAMVRKLVPVEKRRVTRGNRGDGYWEWSLQGDTANEDPLRAHQCTLTKSTQPIEKTIVSQEYIDSNHVLLPDHNEINKLSSFCKSTRPNPYKEGPISPHPIRESTWPTPYGRKKTWEIPLD